jgi:hypothetical protein
MITCYLDSQDYSTLTDPKTLNPERLELRKALTDFARDGRVRFVFSAAAVCEAVAISPEASHLAELKAELLSDLCGANALVSIDRLVAAETKALADRHPPPDMLDQSGNWFPEIGMLEAPEPPWERVRRIAEDELHSMGLSRQQRRAAARKLIKNGEPRGTFKRQMEQQSADAFLAEILKQYPMKPEYAEVMVNYTLGRATEVDFANALQGSLRDPRWMMKWFTTNHAMSSPIADIVRKPGRELGAGIRKIIDATNTWAALLKKTGSDHNPTGKHGELSRRWQELQDQQLINIVQRAAIEHNLSLGSFTAADIDKYCPGISAMVRALYSSAWENIAGSRKEEPSDSQPVDALHAMYAPYVRVFRADRFMTPHIQKHVKHRETIVVSKLNNLVDVLAAEVRRIG